MRIIFPTPGNIDHFFYIGEFYELLENEVKESGHMWESYYVSCFSPNPLALKNNSVRSSRAKQHVVQNTTTYYHLVFKHKLQPGAQSVSDGEKQILYASALMVPTIEQLYKKSWGDITNAFQSKISWQHFPIACSRLGAYLNTYTTPLLLSLHSTVLEASLKTKKQGQQEPYDFFQATKQHLTELGTPKFLQQVLIGASQELINNIIVKIHCTMVQPVCLDVVSTVDCFAEYERPRSTTMRPPGAVPALFGRAPLGFVDDDPYDPATNTAHIVPLDTLKKETRSFFRHHLCDIFAKNILLRHILQLNSSGHVIHYDHQKLSASPFQQITEKFCNHLEAMFPQLPDSSKSEIGHMLSAVAHTAVSLAIPQSLIQLLKMPPQEENEPQQPEQQNQPQPAQENQQQENQENQQQKKTQKNQQPPPPTPTEIFVASFQFALTARGVSIREGVLRKSIYSDIVTLLAKNPNNLMHGHKKTNSVIQSAYDIYTNPNGLLTDIPKFSNVLVFTTLDSYLDDAFQVHQEFQQNNIGQVGQQGETFEDRALALPANFHFILPGVAGKYCDADGNTYWDMCYHRFNREPNKPPKIPYDPDFEGNFYFLSSILPSDATCAYSVVYKSKPTAKVPAGGQPVRVFFMKYPRPQDAPQVIAEAQ